MGLRTQAVHAGEARSQGAVAGPIHRSSTYALGDPASFDDIRYTRLNNTPTQTAVEAKLAALEGGSALVTPSGTAAIWLALATHAPMGSTLLAPRRVYGGTRKILDDMEARGAFRVRYVDLDAPGSWSDALDANTAVFLAESLSNPWLHIGALDRLVELCRQRGIVSIVDNTLLTPVFFRPLAFGFDVVVHSASKHLNGHTDVVAGVVASSPERTAAARRIASRYGICPDPQACYLLGRGIKTLPLRVEAQAASAQLIAERLAAHSDVEWVSYPGLRASPSHERAREWFGGFGTLLSFRPRVDARRWIAALRLAVEAPSLGGVETLVTRPASTSHAGLDAGVRTAMGIGDDDIRVSVGVEDVDDLLKDFEDAFARSAPR